MNFVLIVEGVVVDRAKTPNTLDYSKVEGCRGWSICPKRTDTNMDDGCSLAIAIVDCWDGNWFRMLITDPGRDDHSTLVEREDVVDVVRAKLQELYEAGRLSDHLDPPAIRVIPFDNGEKDGIV